VPTGKQENFLLALRHSPSLRCDIAANDMCTLLDILNRSNVSFEETFWILLYVFSSVCLYVFLFNLLVFAYRTLFAVWKHSNKGIMLLLLLLLLLLWR
jgi:hypothetical protein